ncbi:Fe-S cluster biogenesis scaffold protein [Naegleria gruberi]|uniref:Iron-sulfur cluster assembly protein n=1 Tax=Naegleria gruberi TaxID=5762 RepID=D2V9S9_NAEGR|nr:Fe-S cluster biogenesis scaffold protein [Naegleria gruberi]EFC46190.1 Fe-S cluster biogenesis scaffold protein [Naegleria gruberi]|eukprot:XP_002678934.1 Fe-S cluster biogenesis scaffold protein [Naegleria gruberi strain NEG-M]
MIKSLKRTTTTIANNITSKQCNLLSNKNVFSYSNQIRFKYSDKVIDHHKNPRNSGSLDAKDANVGTALVGAPSCGDVLKFQILVDDNGKVIDAKFKAFGCGSAIASSSYATELVKGKTIEDCMMITNNDIASHLSLPPVKKHCSLLAEEAIRKATEDYMKKKQEKEKFKLEQQQESQSN